MKHHYIGHIYINTSSQDASSAFGNYFGEGIIQLDLDKNDLRVKVANSPLPLTFFTRNLEGMKNGNTVVFMLEIAFALIPASIISFIVKEREDNLKHQQIISGASLFAYWSSNFAMDMFKSLITATLSIGLIYAFEVDVCVILVYIGYLLVYYIYIYIVTLGMGFDPCICNGYYSIYVCYIILIY